MRYVELSTYFLLVCLWQENFFTPAVFGEIIYDNFLFDIPKILDLCVLFGKGNSQLLHKMIGELFDKVHSKGNWWLKANLCTIKVGFICLKPVFLCAACLPGPFDCLQAIKVPLNYIPGKLLRKIQASLMCSDIHHWLGILTKYVEPFGFL